MRVASELEANGSRDADFPRVVVVDDDALFRATLRHLLASEGVEVLGEAGDGHEALQLVRELAPEVVLMDIHLPVLDGIRATDRIAALAPEVRVLVLTHSADEHDVLQAVMAGACGYLLKESPAEELLAGIRAAGAGESLVSPSIAAQLLRHLRADHRAREADGDLSARELEILRLLAAGKDNNEIAADLYLSPKTVKNNVTRILKKLQLRNRIEAAVYATKRGLA